MRPRSPAEDRDEDLFRSRLASILDPRHELLRLAALIDWAALDAAFGPLYGIRGDGGTSHHQSHDEGAEEGFAAAPGIVHEREEAEIERQPCGSAANL